MIERPYFENEPANTNEDNLKVYVSIIRVWSGRVFSFAHCSVLPPKTNIPADNREGFLNNGRGEKLLWEWQLQISFPFLTKKNFWWLCLEPEWKEWGGRRRKKERRVGGREWGGAGRCAIVDSVIQDEWNWHISLR